LHQSRRYININLSTLQATSSSVTAAAPSAAAIARESAIVSALQRRGTNRNDYNDLLFQYTYMHLCCVFYLHWFSNDTGGETRSNFASIIVVVVCRRQRIVGQSNVAIGVVGVCLLHCIVIQSARLDL
jgi:hypothetical protein